MADRARPFTVALAGGSGSGKTTLARALAAMIGTDRCAVIQHDAYYRDQSTVSPERRAATNFDHPESLESGLLADHLAALRDGRAVALPNYDFACHGRLAATTRVDPCEVILCEGILLLAAPELRDAFDLRVFLDVPADIRVLRRLERDIVERGRTVRSVVAQYLATVRPMHEEFVEPARATADLVLGWQDTAARWAIAVIAAMTARNARDAADQRTRRPGGSVA